MSNFFRSRLTRGTIAAVLAAFLLLGGAGSFAYWTSSESTSGATINSGYLKLANYSEGSWLLNGGSTFDPSTQTLVPGDQLTKTVTFSVDGAGTDLEAEFDASAPQWDGSSDASLTDELQLSATYSVNGGMATDGSSPVTVSNGDSVTAVITVDWPYGTQDNTSNVLDGLTAELDAITITATQVDPN